VLSLRCCGLVVGDGLPLAESKGWTRHRSPAAVNREVETLSRIFALAIEQGFVNTNPCRNVRHFREDNERTRYLTEDEEVKLFAVLCDKRQHLASIVGTGSTNRHATARVTATAMESYRL